jgi:hypothetical protein
MLCAYVRLFPTVETVYAIEVKGEFRTQLFDHLCKAKSTLRKVIVLSGSLRLDWTADNGCK